jgi:hypothetical protein
MKGRTSALMTGRRRTRRRTSDRARPKTAMDNARDRSVSREEVRSAGGRRNIAEDLVG